LPERNGIPRLLMFFAADQDEAQGTRPQKGIVSSVAGPQIRDPSDPRYLQPRPVPASAARW
jgi:hypothetical protein